LLLLLFVERFTKLKHFKYYMQEKSLKRFKKD
jgi:hypothetical protein